MRDDFPEGVKRTLAARVGNKCSNPDCRALTSGPQTTADKALNVGVASHVTAAAPGGERYDSSLTADERAHTSNGIWLCQNCAKLIDNDPLRYTEGLLRSWKTIAEDRALHEIGRTAVLVNETEAQRKQRAILPYTGTIVKLSQMNTGRAILMSGPVRGSSYVEVFEVTEFFVTIGKRGQDAFSRSIPRPTPTSGTPTTRQLGSPGRSSLRLSVGLWKN